MNGDDLHRGNECQKVWLQREFGTNRVADFQSGAASCGSSNAIVRHVDPRDPAVQTRELKWLFALMAAQPTRRPLMDRMNC